MKQACQNCRYWHDDSEDGKGLCRRYPPVVLWEARDEEVVTWWPETHEDYWCGEYEQRKKGDPE